MEGVRTGFEKSYLISFHQFLSLWGKGGLKGGGGGGGGERDEINCLILERCWRGKKKKKKKKKKNH